MFSSFKMKKYFKKYCVVMCIIIAFIIMYYFGAATHFFELDYDSDFSYPLHQNIVGCVIAEASGNYSQCPKINSYDYNFIIKNKKCEDDKAIQLVFLIKSGINNTDRRNAIRNSWGKESRFSDVIMKRVFLLGVHKGNTKFKNIENEQEMHDDIVQADFFDTYYNNTLKTMTGFRWAVESCANSKFYVFVDDDMYISVKNILRFIRNPTEYPQYFKKSENPDVNNFVNKQTYYELPENVKLFAGFVFQSAPHRHQCSKWYVSMKEYPYNKWPPYVGAGSYVVSKEALKLMYYASFFTEHFRFDDIYLGILAKKMGIEPFHCPEFHVMKTSYRAQDFDSVISSHGYHSEQLLKIWTEQKSLGNA